MRKIALLMLVIGLPCSILGMKDTLPSYKAEEQAEYPCALCSTIFSQVEDIEEHYLIIHSDEHFLLPKESPMVAQDNSYLITESDEDSYNESKKASKKSKRPKKRVHPSGDNEQCKYQCQECERSFPSLISLNNHKRVHKRAQVAQQPTLLTAVAIQSKRLRTKKRQSVTERDPSTAQNKHNITETTARESSLPQGSHHDEENLVEVLNSLKTAKIFII